MPTIVMMLRAIKVRLYPNKEQELKLNKVLGCYRFVYNNTLALKQQKYNEEKLNLGIKELSNHFHNSLLKDEQYVWLKEINTKVLKQAIRQMLIAYKNFFELHRGYPHFKSKKNWQSALFPLEAISKKNTFETKHITLTSDLKHLKFRCSNLQFNRLQSYKDRIRNATLSKTKTNKFFLSILVEIDEKEYQHFKHTNQRVGIDLGIKDFVITSDAEVFENKHFYKQEEQTLRKLHKQLNKKQKGSRNREKARLKLAKAYERISNRKENYIHYIVNSLLSMYDTIFIENLNVQGMLRNHKLSKAIQELGFYTFRNLLESKAQVNDKQVILIDRWYASSKICNVCGYKYNNLTLRERHWICPQCGEHHDRDINASINILKEGERIIGVRSTEYMLVENPTMADKVEIPLKSSGLLKQEIKSENS